MAENEEKIRRGMAAYGLMEKIRGGDKNEAILADFEKVRADLGYGLLLKRYTPTVVDANEEMIRKAARDTIPNVALMFWAFRSMVGLGFWMLFLIGLSFYFCARRVYHQKRWLLRLLLISLPAPWIACWLGWFVVEYGRQPWTIGGVLPTYFSASSLSSGDVLGSLAALIFLYTLLAVPWFYLMQKYARRGPSALHTGRYHFEQTSPEAAS
jgi:cytochrome d ubiquinol oxidase subunit I